MRIVQEGEFPLTTESRVKGGLRAGSAEMPRLAALAGHIVESKEAGAILELRTFKPRDVASEILVARALRTVAEYAASYVTALAKKDPDGARMLAESFEVPWVREVQRENGGRRYVVEVVTLGKYLDETALRIGEAAARAGVKRIAPKKARRPTRARA